MDQIAVHYLWWIVALLLIGGEVILPGYFMLWIGIAAAAMGVVLLVLPGMGALAQAVVFVVFAFVSCFVYWKVVRPRLERIPAGNERLNRRGEQLIGQRYTLCEPIVQGRGKARVGDGMWLVTGPDLPLGATVEVTGIDGTTLRVKAVDVG
ncbi:membrane protein implicated in regulation of membrane protease activity [Luteibacter jiangsuensis]|uniref:Membrane protein implicated in regulation of membrane protease activity n=1 Tax=Luteibacter jiangsuensis TaxID=637577 RepID=A0ABT9T349_9GAMM|nr:NfeD family protein [Luteibacter jiangsuensis]MDQ0011259.1 membrane protein implicated in regulation of membrane protease activity [Luteibacter jiangsuensis]